MSLEGSPSGRVQKGTAVIEWRYTYRFSTAKQWRSGNKADRINQSPSKMAVREPFQRDFRALPVEKPRKRTPRDHRTDGTHPDSGTARRLGKRLDPALRHRAQDLVVIAAGNQRLQSDDAARHQIPRRVRKRN